MLDDNVDDIIGKLGPDSWTNEVSIEEFAKPIDTTALKNILLETNKIAFEMIA